MVVDEQELLARVRYAEKLADKALDMALKAVTKVEAMEKSTHKAYFLNPMAPSELNPPHPYEPDNSMSEQEMNKKLDSLFDGLKPDDFTEEN